MDEESPRSIRHWLKQVFRRLGRPDKPRDLEKEIQHLIDEGEQRGFITEDEGEMIHSIFSFRGTIAREIMVPRIDTVCAPMETGIDEIIQLIGESGHTRIPIYQDNVDNIIGILHAKDLLSCWGRNDFDIRSLVRPPNFIPDTKKVSAVLKDLRFKKSHMAIVIDEYGGTAGVLTLEDVIEEIVGDIFDEYDAEENWIIQEGDGTLIVDARLDLEELEEHVDVRFPDGKFESVGGFMINFLGKVPGIREKVVFNNLELVVEAADKRRIEKIRIRKLEHEAPEPGLSDKGLP